MKLSVWVFVSDLVVTRQTKFEKIVSLFDKKYTMFQTLPHYNIFQSLKQAGVDGLELLIPSYASDKNIEDIKGIVNKNKIPVFSIHQSLSNINSITLAEIEKLCSIANTFTATVVVLHSGTLKEKLFDPKFIYNLKHLQRKYNIIFGIENMEKMPLLSSKLYTYKGNEFSSAVNEAGLSITFDTTHLGQVGEDIIQFYLANKEKIINIHISDCKNDWLNRHVFLHKSTHLPLGYGDLPIKDFLKILKNERYKGIITMETNANLEQICESAKIIKTYMD